MISLGQTEGADLVLGALHSVDKQAVRFTIPRCTAPAHSTDHDAWPFCFVVRIHGWIWFGCEYTHYTHIHIHTTTHKRHTPSRDTRTEGKHAVRPMF